jgi:hypothetical protein
MKIKEGFECRHYKFVMDPTAKYTSQPSQGADGKCRSITILDFMNVSSLVIINLNSKYIKATRERQTIRLYDDKEKCFNIDVFSFN